MLIERAGYCGGHRLLLKNQRVLRRRLSLRLGYRRSTVTVIENRDAEVQLSDDY